MKKRSILLTLSLVVITVISTRAQGFHVGVKGGANIMRVHGESFDNGFKFNYHLGAFAEINFPGAWGIQPEVLFSQTEYQTGSNAQNVATGVTNAKGKLNYLEIPILLSFKPIPLLSIQAGPQFGILMSQQKDLVANGASAFKSGDFSLVGGAQLNLAKLKVGARYQVGLSNINDVTSTENWKNGGFQVYVGYRLF